MTRWRIHDLPRLAALRDEWADLWRRDPRASPFQSPDWILSWLEAYEAAPVALIARDAGRLVGLAVFAIREGAAGRITLEFAGTGPSDYLDAVIDPDHLVTALDEIMAQVSAFARDGVRIDLRQLNAASPLLRAPGAFLEDTIQEDAWCPGLDLAPLEDEMPAQIPAAFRKRLHYARRRAERESGAEFALVDSDDLDGAMREFFRLFRDRWAVDDSDDEPAPPRFARLLELATRATSNSGALRFLTLRLEGRVAAGLIGFIVHGTFYYYLGAFDSAFSRHSPGSLIIAEAMRRAIEEGATRFDFLRGCEPYKFRWGATPRVTYRRTLGGPAVAVRPRSSTPSIIPHAH